MDYQTKTNLILPFKGILMVSNGGRTPETNNHNRPADKGPQNMLYAYDFRTDCSDQEKSLDKFPVFDKEVIAPGEGVVIQVINGAIDVMPGERDRSVGVGNAVIIDHQNGEYSLLCHFKHDSIKVVVGNKVKQGEVIALCGNTGNTSQPHIHFHLQDNPRLHLGRALPVQFKKINVNGEIKENYEPIRGEKVSNP